LNDRARLLKFLDTSLAREEVTLKLGNFGRRQAMPHVFVYHVLAGTAVRDHRIHNTLIGRIRRGTFGDGAHS
jgi:hypothetical protein